MPIILTGLTVFASVLATTGTGVESDLVVTNSTILARSAGTFVDF